MEKNFVKTWMASIVILSLIAIPIYAANETVTMKVGETKTLYLPSSVTSKAPRAASWMSTRPNEIQVMSYTTYSVTIKAVKTVPATTTCLVNCRYYYIVYSGSFKYQMTGIYDYKIETEATEPNSVSLPQNVSLNVGESKYLTATVNPSDAVTELTWSSSDYPTINVFQDGKILAQKEGTSVITVRTSNGKTASCTVTATKPNVAVTSINMAPSLFTINVGDKYKLTATISPSNATDKSIIWSSNNTSVVCVDNNGNITGVSPGSAIVTAKTSNGKTATCSITCKAIIPDIVINDSKGMSSVPTIANVKYDRMLYKGWNSICLPFSLKREQLDVDAAKLVVVKDVETIGSEKYVSFESVDNVDTGVPCLVYTPVDYKLSLDLKEVQLVDTPNDNSILKGSFDEVEIGEGCYKLSSNGNSFSLTKSDKAVSKPFRAYINLVNDDRNSSRATSLTSNNEIIYF